MHVVDAAAFGYVLVRYPVHYGVELARCRAEMDSGRLTGSRCLEGDKLHNHSVRAGDLNVDLFRHAIGTGAEREHTGGIGDAVTSGADGPVVQTVLGASSVDRALRLLCAVGSSVSRRGTIGPQAIVFSTCL